MELGLNQQDEEDADQDDDSEYSGMVSSWRSGNDSVDLLSTAANSLDILTPPSHHLEESRVFRNDTRRWKHDKLCR